MNESIVEEILRRIASMERWRGDREQPRGGPQHQERGRGERERDRGRGCDCRCHDDGRDHDHGHEHFPHTDATRGPGDMPPAGFDEKRLVDLIVRLVSERVDMIVERRLASLGAQRGQPEGREQGPREGGGT